MRTSANLSFAAREEAQPASGGGAIDVRDVSVRFALRTGGENVVALDDVSLNVTPGRFVTLIGPSGCGKTTLLKVVAGMLAPATGSVTIDGVDVADAGASLGIMFQKPLLLPWRTSLENVLLPVDVRGRRKSADVDRARRTLELVGLGEFVNAYPNELSMGMQQRVAIARTLLRDPAVMLMDEPFSALDELTRETMNAELLRVWEQSGKTILFVTHNVGEAIFLSDEVIVMGPNGRLEHWLDVDLPRPRTTPLLDTEEYAEHVRSARRALGLTA